MSVRTQRSAARADRSALRVASPIRLIAFKARFLALEFVAVMLAACFSTMLYHQMTAQTPPAVSEYGPAAAYLAGLVLITTLSLRQFSAIQHQPWHLLLWNGLGAVALAFSLFLTTLFLLKGAQQYSRGAFILQMIIVSAVVCFSRTSFYFWLQAVIRSGIIAARRVILIGDELTQHFDSLVGTAAIRSIARLPFPVHKHRNGAKTVDCDPLIDSRAAQQLIDDCRAAHPDDIVIFASREELSAAPELARLLSELPVSVHIVPFSSFNFFGTSRIAELGDLKTLELSRPPLSVFDLAVKRAFDIVVAAGGLVLLTPLFALVALAIKLESRGNVLFWQDRHGYNKTVIRVAKFRSMYENANEEGFIQARRDDDRVTRVGRILRRTNIDELPQLFNVLTGDMSIVGPRPHATAHNEMFEGRILPFSRRHNIKPGITGWAQVNGHRGETDTLEKMRRRVEHDLYYIDNWSLLLDLKIILLTLCSKRSYVNAY
jgi:Undecaprenyl-phosphate glucose phosphotransferase